MSLKEEILKMYYEENLTIGEIAGALRQDPNYVYNVVYRQWYKYREDEAI